MNASSEPDGGVLTLRWLGSALELIDQRHLPQRFDYVRCSTALEVAAAIRDMVVRGAPAIGCAAAFGVALEAARQADAARPAFDAALEQAFSVLAASRPTAVNLFWALDRMRACWQASRGGAQFQIAASLAERALALYHADIATNLAIGRAGAALMEDGDGIMTHCNAGALATAGHGTALGVIRSARDQGKRISVIANETRPFLQGARLTAWEMVQEKIPVTLITDNMAGHLMSQGKVQKIIVGADRIAANGDTANKIGTYALAVLARYHQIPFYIAAPLSTIDLGIANGGSIVIEERAASEVTGYGGVRWAPEGVSVANPAFDVTPAELISALITEKGVTPRPATPSVTALFR
ncbi:MAG: S-methyl-5-thioribose-1-phosphate isomerase [Betaproteobacteria bacterium]|nr:S-methyl-5-thioribose-1-phosphate isomerase [Betaproteobacteria bacterium]